MQLRTTPAKVETRLCGVLLVAIAVGCAAAHESDLEVDRLVGELSLAQGKRVADVGAGHGEFSELLARIVGRGGHVYATEVDEDDLQDIRDRLEDTGLGNATVILGDQHDTGLPESCCDAILLRLVYHHFTEPAEMRASLRRALRPGGRIAVVDLPPQRGWSELDGVPDRGGHGIPLEDLVAEMTGDGFAVVSRHEAWDTDENDTYCVVFERSATASAVP